jgi:hypothetical protein
MRNKFCKWCGRGEVKGEANSECYGRTEWCKTGRYVVPKKHKYIYTEE